MENEVFLSFNDILLKEHDVVMLHSLDFDDLVGNVVGFSDLGLEVFSLNGCVYFCDFSRIVSLEKIA